MTYSILLDKPLHHFARRLYIVSWALLLLSLAVYMSRFMVDVPENEAIIAPKEKPLEQRAFSPITLAAFDVTSESEAILLPQLSSLLAVYSRPDRPDVAQKGWYFAFDNDRYCFIPSGESRYLSIERDVVSVSDTPTPLKLSVEGDMARCSLQVDSPSGEKLISHEYSFTKEQLKKVNPVDTKELDDFVSHIRKLSVYPPDLFFQMYGGATYKQKGLGYRLGNVFSHVYQVSEGDVFTLQEGVLVPIEQPVNAMCPLLRVLKVQSGAMEIEAWDRSGRTYKRVTLRSEIRPDITLSPEELFKDVRLRGKRKALVKVGKKTKALQPGDYLLHKKRAWKKVDEKDELERLLNYIDCGMLFVFEGFETRNKDVYFCGQLFDETRSVAREVALPVKKKLNPSPVKERMPHRDDPYEDLPPELEELFDELDDL